MAKVALLYPPVTDPTSGYHSLSYIDSYARAQANPAADLVDVNIEAFHYSYSPAGLAWLDQGWRRRATTTRTATTPSTRGRGRAHAARRRPDPQRVRDAVATLQDPERFYDYGQYQGPSTGSSRGRTACRSPGSRASSARASTEAPPMLASARPRRSPTTRC
ncbi:hypothetical protein GCM10020218_002260 [Dactylosporangium vinaceum]